MCASEILVENVSSLKIGSRDRNLKNSNDILIHTLLKGFLTLRCFNRNALVSRTINQFKCEDDIFGTL